MDSVLQQLLLQGIKLKVERASKKKTGGGRLRSWEGLKFIKKIKFLSSIGLVFIGKLRQLLIVRVNSP